MNTACVVEGGGEVLRDKVSWPAEQWPTELPAQFGWIRRSMTMHRPMPSPWRTTRRTSRKNFSKKTHSDPDAYAILPGRLCYIFPQGSFSVSFSYSVGYFSALPHIATWLLPILDSMVQDRSSAVISQSSWKKFPLTSTIRIPASPHLFSAIRTNTSDHFCSIVISLH